MSEDIEEQRLKLNELEGRTDKIKRELNETFVQVSTDPWLKLAARAHVIRMAFEGAKGHYEQPFDKLI